MTPSSFLRPANQALPQDATCLPATVVIQGGVCSCQLPPFLQAIALHPRYQDQKLENLSPGVSAVAFCEPDPTWHHQFLKLHTQSFVVGQVIENSHHSF